LEFGRNLESVSYYNANPLRLGVNPTASLEECRMVLKTKWGGRTEKSNKRKGRGGEVRRWDRIRRILKRPRRRGAG